MGYSMRCTVSFKSVTGRRVHPLTFFAAGGRVSSSIMIIPPRTITLVSVVFAGGDASPGALGGGGAQNGAWMSMGKWSTRMETDASASDLGSSWVIRSSVHSMTLRRLFLRLTQRPNPHFGIDAHLMSCSVFPMEYSSARSKKSAVAPSSLVRRSSRKTYCSSRCQVDCFWSPRASEAASCIFSLCSSSQAREQSLITFSSSSRGFSLHSVRYVLTSDSL
mmetsp:Transcript_11734/g.28986  ORF Transcript_11734/g.28986 Transcript_11734/m.28986 type:complete len:220 (+) Transcript_11734:1300-1959(+)